MQGKELKFTLCRLGITYKEFGELIGKNYNTIQRWISYNQNVGEKFLIPIRKNFAKQILKKIESEWLIHVEEKKQREEEYLRQMLADDE